MPKTKKTKKKSKTWDAVVRSLRELAESLERRKTPARKPRIRKGWKS